jgi:hypothetical protein
MPFGSSKYSAKRAPGEDQCADNDFFDHRSSTPNPYSESLRCQRDLTKRIFTCVKDFRRVVTHYDKFAQNFVAGAILAATPPWWIR